MIIIKPLNTVSLEDFLSFYTQALADEHMGLIPSENVEQLLSETRHDFKQYDTHSWTEYWLKKKGTKAFVAINQQNDIIGCLTVSYFDNQTSLICDLTALSTPDIDKLREALLQKVYKEFTGVTDIFIEVYERRTDEVSYYKNLGFRIYDSPITVVAGITLKTHLMYKHV